MHVQIKNSSQLCIILFSRLIRNLHIIIIIKRNRFQFQRILRKLHGVEKLLDTSFEGDNLNNIQIAEHNLNYILLLKSIVDILPEFNLIMDLNSSIIFDTIMFVSIH